MEFKDGDVIQVNGKPCRIEGGALVPVVQRGPLGGELKLITEVDPNNYPERREMYLRLNRIGANDGETIRARYEHKDCGLMPKIINVPVDAIVEVNIPHRPTFTPMTAGDAAKVPGIVGRWVAVQIDEQSHNQIGYGGKQGAMFSLEDQILLIEGVDLP